MDENWKALVAVLFIFIFTASYLAFDYLREHHGVTITARVWMCSYHENVRVCAYENTYECTWVGMDEFNLDEYFVECNEKIKKMVG